MQFSFCREWEKLFKKAAPMTAGLCAPEVGAASMTDHPAKAPKALHYAPKIVSKAFLIVRVMTYWPIVLGWTRSADMQQE